MSEEEEQQFNTPSTDDVPKKQDSEIEEPDEGEVTEEVDPG